MEDRDKGTNNGILMSGQETRRHPQTPPYRCFLSDLTEFEGLRRAGPTRTDARIPDVPRYVNGDCLEGNPDKGIDKTGCHSMILACSAKSFSLRLECTKVY
jgi:hypothetical protein